MSDQHNARVMGCAGHPQIHTPVLDRLAADGVRCTHAFTQSPICTPSRVCYFSGQYILNHGYAGLEGQPPHQLPTLFSYFRAHGYLTGIAGKIHTPAGWLSPGCDVLRDGYGHEYQPAQNFTDISNDDPSCWPELPPDDYAAYLESRGLLHLRDDDFLPEWRAIHGRCAAQGLDARPSQLGEHDTIEAWAAAETIAMVEQAHRAGRPFCCCMSAPRPHEVYTPAQRFWDLYDENTLELPPSADDSLDDRHPTMRAQKAAQLGDPAPWALFEPRDYARARKRVLRGYYGCISQVDDAVGRVLARLEELGLRENTIVVYCSDHGEFAGEHGLLEKAPGIGSRAVTRIPMIWSWPGHLPQGALCEGLTETVDLLPTLAALAGLPAPNWSDGCDLTALLHGEVEAVREIAVTEAPLAHAVHTSRYTLVHYPATMNDGAEFGELFDYQDDPWERTNRYFDPAYHTVVEELRRQLLDWSFSRRRCRTVLPVLIPQPYADDGTVRRNTIDALTADPANLWKRNYL
jgi:arylsulfatase A-like enzyme